MGEKNPPVKTTYFKHREDENDFALTAFTLPSSTNTRLDSHLTCPLFQSPTRSTGTWFLRTKRPQFLFRGARVLTKIHSAAFHARAWIPVRVGL